MPMADEQGEELQPYKYGGKEFDTMHGLNLYEYHARQYDAALGRFTSIDSLAEKYYHISPYSPYSYVMNNPMKYIDSDGKWGGLAQMYYGTNAPATIVQQQKAETIKIDSSIPSAVSVPIATAGIDYFMGVSSGASGVLFLRGEDAGRIKLYNIY